MGEIEEKFDFDFSFAPNRLIQRTFIWFKVTKSYFHTVFSFCAKGFSCTLFIFLVIGYLYIPFYVQERLRLRFSICFVFSDICSSFPCMNGGKCEPAGVSYICQCKDRYRGIRCEIDTDPCQRQPCLNGGM